MAFAMRLRANVIGVDARGRAARLRWRFQCMVVRDHAKKMASAPTDEQREVLPKRDKDCVQQIWHAAQAVVVRLPPTCGVNCSVGRVLYTCLFDVPGTAIVASTTTMEHLNIGRAMPSMEVEGTGPPLKACANMEGRLHA